MTRVLVLGANGLLGSSLVPHLRGNGHEVLVQSRKPPAHILVDPTDARALLDAVGSVEPEVVVNLIAATNVDRCEVEPDEAWTANSAVVQHVVDALKATGIGHLIHISTDQVYDGSGPHVESAAHPLNVYARTKLAGEQIAAAAGATVLRTNFVGRSRCAGRQGLSDWIVASLRSAQPITVFDDVLFGPLHVTTLCQLIDDQVRLRRPGIFNAGSSEGVSKSDFAFELARHLGLSDESMTRGLSTAVTTRAPRPLDMRMDMTAAREQLGFEAPTMAQEIQRTAQDYMYA